MQDTIKSSSPKTLVLVHGAWHGGWCWARVAKHLRKAGHTVFTPTLTGLGERRHILAPNITLQTFIDDIANVLSYEDLNDVILVGHSFGGLVTTGVADIMPHRLEQLVYLDALILEGGTSIFDSLPPDISNQLNATAQLVGQTLTLPPASLERLGLFDPKDRAFVEGRLTPQPLGSYKTSVPLQHPIGNGLPCTYVHCNNPPFKALKSTRNWVKTQTQWRWLELDAGHDAMVCSSENVANLLMSL